MSYGYRYGYGFGRRSGGVGSNPASLFAAGEQGAYWDWNDPLSMWADTGLTTRAAPGEPVLAVTDKLNRGITLLQPTSGSAPILRKRDTLYTLDWGGNKWMSCSLDLSATDEVTVIAGLRKISDSAAAIFCELTTNASGTTGGFYLAAPQNTGASGNYSFFCRGNVGTTPAVSATALSPNTAVITCLGKISTDQMTIARNGTQEGSQTGNQGTGNFANATLFVGGRGGTSLFFSGEGSGLIIRGKLTSGADLANAQAWMGARTGDGSLRATQAYFFGDSTVAAFDGQLATSALVNSGRTVISLAVAGDSIQGQEAILAGTSINPATTGYIYGRIGLNNMNPVEALAVTTARMQSFVNTARGKLAGGSGKIILGQTIEVYSRWIEAFGATNGPLAYAKQRNFNAAIAGLTVSPVDGSPLTPITGIDGFVTEHVPLLKDDTNSLRAEYILKPPGTDLIHPITAGRSVMAAQEEIVIRAVAGAV